MNPITVAASAVNAKLVDPTREDKLVLMQLLSYPIEGALDGRRGSFFDFDTGTFPAGFIMRVYRAFTQAGRKVNLIRKPLPAPLGPEAPVVDKFPEDPRYDYQRQVIDLLSRYGQIVAQVATGGGKSRIAKLAFARIQRPTLFLTTRGILMHQMRDAFMRDLNIPVGIFGDDEWTEKPELMNCGMVQTFATRLELKTVENEMRALTERRLNAEDKATKELIAQYTRKVKKGEMTQAAADSECKAAVERMILGMRVPYGSDTETVDALRVKVFNHNRRRQETIELLSKFEVLILEEAHEASSASYYDITRQCTNCHYRLALTGTPFMKDSEQANMQLEAASGAVAIRVSELMLIERGILAKPHFKYVHLPSSPDGVCVDNDGKEIEAKLYRSTPYARAYEIGITGAKQRNLEIVKEVQRAKDYGLSSMILVLHKSHGKRLLALLSNAGIRTNFIEGEHDQNARKASIDALKAGKIDCLIGSTILDVGVDVPAVGLVVLAGAGKAEVAVRQRIGRGLRAKSSGPNVCFILDFTDPLNNHLRDHARERRRIIDTTPGFADGVVPDFPYEQVGYRKVSR